jgi:hypothetical protein
MLGDDYLTEIAATSCNGDSASAMTSAEVDLLKNMTVLHETAHGLDVEHSNDCGSVMLLSNVLPIPSTLTLEDRQQIRIHRKY